MHDVAVVCLSICGAYRDDYVYKLRNMVARHTSHPYDFICFSDHNIPGIRHIDVDMSLELDPLWYKIWLLTHPALNQYKRKIFFDLDVVIHGNIDHLFERIIDGLTVIESCWKPADIAQMQGNTGINTSIMIWENFPIAWEHFMKSPDYYMLKYKGIDRFLWNEGIGVSLLDPGIVYSYREGADENDTDSFKYRPNMAVCIFHQHPKPHEIPHDTLVVEFWK